MIKNIFKPSNTRLIKIINTLISYGLFGWEEKIRGKKMKRRENKEKNIFSLLLFSWVEK